MWDHQARISGTPSSRSPLNMPSETAQSTLFVHTLEPQYQTRVQPHCHRIDLVPW